MMWRKKLEKHSSFFPESTLTLFFEEAIGLSFLEHGGGLCCHRFVSEDCILIFYRLSCQLENLSTNNKPSMCKNICHWRRESGRNTKIKFLHYTLNPFQRLHIVWDLGFAVGETPSSSRKWLQRPVNPSLRCQLRPLIKCLSLLRGRGPNLGPRLSLTQWEITIAVLLFNVSMKRITWTCLPRSSWPLIPRCHWLRPLHPKVKNSILCPDNLRTPEVERRALSALWSKAS